MRPKCVRARVEYSPSPEPPNLTAGRCMSYPGHPCLMLITERGQGARGDEDKMERGTMSAKRKVMQIKWSAEYEREVMQMQIK